MIRLPETQLGLEIVDLDRLFSYACGAPSQVATFRHPGIEYVDYSYTHALVRPKESFDISLLHDPNIITPLDVLPSKIAASIVGCWLRNEMILPQANQAERNYV